MDFRSLHQVFFIMILLSQLQNCFTYAFDYDDDNDSSSRCPWIRNKLKNGRVKIRSRGRIAKFLCDPGYELAGKRFATCVRGQWNNPIPICVARGCPKLPEPANGRVSEMYRGALLIYDCLPGYVLDGDMSVFCDGRRWNASLPACVVAKENPSMTCDFESPDLCGWNHDPTHDFDWQRNQHSTPSGHVGTGPSFDHTYGEGKGGFYLYIEASSPRKVNDTSRIFSPVFPMDYSGGCFSFWYHMYGSTTGGLRVYIRPESSVFDEVSPTWEKFGDQGNQWRMGNISVPYYDQNFQIVIEGIRGTSYIGDTAIDDVNISTTGCDNIANGTENSIEVSEDSCRGRCLEQADMTEAGCGCDDSCSITDNCCSDYQLICTSGTSSVSDNPEELPAGDLLPTTSMLSTMYDTTNMFSTMVSSTIKQNSLVDVSPDITHSESSGMHFTSETETVTLHDISLPIQTNNSSPIPTFISSPTPTNSLSPISTDGELPVSTNSAFSTTRSSPTPPDSSWGSYDGSAPIPSESSSLIPVNSSSPILTDSSTFISIDGSTNVSTSNSLPFSKYSSSVNTDKSSVMNTDSSSAVVTDISTPISYDNSSSKTMPIGAKSNISTTQFFTTPKMLLTETKNSTDNSTTAFIGSTQLWKNATNSDLLTTLKSIRISSTVIQSTSDVPDVLSTVKAIKSTESSDNIILTSSETRRTYNLRPRTKKTTAAEWIDATTVSTTFSKLKASAITNKETVISKSTPPIIYRYTSSLTNTAVDATVSSHLTSAETSSVSSRETIIVFPVSNIPSTPLESTVVTEKYITTVPYAYSTKTTSSYPEPIDSSASKSASTSASSDAIVTIVSVTLVIAVAFVGGWTFFVRRKRAKRQSKLSDDSELRYLQANEITDY
ncbi:uncharacterized protein LOC129218373 [Uloborus diversus]|uniref:uncharacterized protein LOC129218373 n=1 Tax=Uloborus diversus TaxID=327109 RepID=UPI00240A7106|nr:uncharacterized protein LOC129218373 [Uloborus diversus]